MTKRDQIIAHYEERIAKYEVRLVAADALVEALGALYAWEFEETGTLLASWKERFPNIAWTKREIKLAAQAALRKYWEAVK